MKTLTLEPFQSLQYQEQGPFKIIRPFGYQFLTTCNLENS